MMQTKVKEALQLPSDLEPMALLFIGQVIDQGVAIDGVAQERIPHYRRQIPGATGCCPPLACRNLLG